jgi:hypothetical protein
MAERKLSRQLEATIQSIKDEWKSSYRKSPELTIFALRDGAVIDAIEKRFSDKASIAAVRGLEYNFYTGLHNLIFEFTGGVGHAGKVGTDAFLAILDGDGNIVALVDPFDPVQPNKFVPPLPTQGADNEQPFVLDRPRADVAIGEQEMYPSQVRSREFLQRLMIDPGGPIITQTNCDYTTWTPVGYQRDNAPDDCGVPDPGTILA